MMKNLIFLAIFLLISCSNSENSSSSGQNSDMNLSKGGSFATFAIKNDYLYVVDEQNLNVFSIKNLKNPEKLGKVRIGFDIETLFSMGDYLFIGSQTGMYIYSVESPETPTQLARAEHFRACDPVVANATHAFVTLHSTREGRCATNLNELQVYDIADIKSPKLLSRRQLTKPQGLAILSDKHLAVCDDDLKIISIENPEDTRVEVNSIIKKSYKDLVFHNNILFAFGEKIITQYKYNPNPAVGGQFLEQISEITY